MPTISATKIRRLSATMMVCAVAIIAALYATSIFSDFINWDDPDYIVNNPALRVLDWQFVREAFTTSYMGWWMPLTWISLALDYHFWGLNPVGYHLTNVLLHSANAGLVVLLASRLLGSVTFSEGEGSGKAHAVTVLLAALLWGLHPLRVESVAWVTERKDVLNGLFSLATLISYLDYVRLKSLDGRGAAAYRMLAASVLLLLLSVMSKPVSVVIPAMLLLADWFPLGRFSREGWQRLLLEKIPYGVVVVAVALATVLFAAGNRILVAFDDLTLAKRFVLAGHSLFEYVSMSLYPVDIIHIYLLPWPFPASYAVKAAIVAGFCCLCLWLAPRKPWIPATWLAFVLPLLPVLGFLQNGAQSHAARFTYLAAVIPSIALAFVLHWAYERCTAVRGNRLAGKLLIAAVVLAVSALAVITLRHLAAWKNSETLWTRAIEIRPVGRAYYLRADYYLSVGRYRDAAVDLLKSIELANKAGFPEVFNLHALRGDALLKDGRPAEALEEFNRAISINPYPGYYYHRGLSLEALGRTVEANADFIRAGDATGPIEWRKLK